MKSVTRQIRIAVGALLLSAAVPVSASEPFRITVVRGEEDWIADADPERLAELPRGKAVKLGERSFLTLGGEWRVAFEHFDHEEWGAVPGSDSFFLNRFLAHAAWTHLPRSGPFDRVRVFAQLQHGDVYERGSEPRVPDVDRLDWNAGFLELRTRPGRLGRFTLRAGRQELHYGAGRLLSVRAGSTNTRFSYDGVLLRWEKGPWRTDLFSVQPNETDPGTFDNDPLPGRKLRGVYATRSSKLGGLDLYGFADERPQTYFQGAGRETRYSVGVRLFRNGPRLRRDYLLTAQWGDFEPLSGPEGDIEAWTVSTNVHYVLRPSGSRPTANFFLGYTTGDDDPDDPDVQTFRAPYPPGRYFGAGAPNGPLNVAFYRLGVAWQPRPRLELDTGFFDFYRESKRDGAYGVPGNPLIPPGTSAERPIGRLLELKGVFSWNRHTEIEAEAAYFFAGDYLDAEAAEDTFFLGARMVVRY